MSDKKKSKQKPESEVSSAAVAEEEVHAATEPAAEEAHDHDHDHDHDHGKHGHHHHHHHGHDHGHEEEEEIFVEDPQFDIDYKGDCSYQVKVTIPVANEKKQSDKMYDELTDEADVPGFRRGKVPRRLIERKFSKSVRHEVDGKLVSASFQKLIKDKGLKPIAMPDIEGLDAQTDRKEGEPLSFTLKFEVAPRVELGKYRGVAVERPVVSIDDNDLDASIKEMRERSSIFEPLEGGVAAEGDQVVIDFSGAIDGQAFSGGSAEKYPYVLGSKRFFAEFESVLLGASPGDDLTCAVTFPADYFNAQLREKDAQFTIKVHEVKRRNMPELTEEFAQQSGYETVADLREKVTAELRSASETQSNRIAESRALKAVIDNSTFEIPKSYLEAATHELEEEEIRRLMSMRIPMDKIEERREEIHAQALESALNDIKAVTVLTEIGEAEGVEVTDEDYEKEIASIAERNRLGVDAVAQYLEQQGQRNTYEGRIFRAKALALVMSLAEVTDKEVPRDEVENEAEGTKE